MSGSLGELSLAEAGRAIAAGRVSPIELTDFYLDRIEATEPAVHAYFTVSAEAARAAARRAAAEIANGDHRGPLHGVPLGVKDLIDTAGVRTTYGSPRYADRVPDRDATATASLRRAGAVLLGKHATHELAWGGRTDSAFFGPTHNPYRRDHIPGGSSGGSAASVVAHSSLGAIGTDTAGSVRIPAALSGCVGFKPTRGLVSLAGVLPLCGTLDHVGALARTVDDAALITAAIAGHDPADPRTLFDPVPDLAARDLGDVRIGWLAGWFDTLLSPGVAATVQEIRHRLETYGIRIDEVNVPDEPHLTESVLTRILAEAGALHRPAFEADPRLFGGDLAQLLDGPAPTPRQLARSEATVARFAAGLLTTLSSYDVLLCATVPVTAPKIGDQSVTVRDQTLPIELVLTRLTSPFNAVGLPALSVPVALAGGLPVGLQVVGRRLEDDLVLNVGRLVETVRPEVPRPALATTEGSGEHS
jgi:aspartyl-tRNA(Asn)/glutamyl-tRNA(Gln) amidotransferase subunit A